MNSYELMVKTLKTHHNYYTNDETAKKLDLEQLSKDVGFELEIVEPTFVEDGKVIRKKYDKNK